MAQDAIVITSYARTPIGSFLGALSSLRAQVLGGAAIRAALGKSTISPAAVDQAIMGCVLPAGLGQAPARQASLAANLSMSTRATTINKMCGSGMQAVIMAHDAVAAGSANVIVAGGMESMSNAPYLLAKHRSGIRIGHGDIKDSMFLDGLEDAYEPGKLMGAFADEIAHEFKISREMQDAYAISSFARAQAAQANGDFADEIVSVNVAGKKGTSSVEADEQPGRSDPAKIPTMSPAFSKGGTVTAANASSISDGAAAMLLMRSSTAHSMDIKPIARVVAHSAYAQEPARFAVAPIPVIKSVLDQAGWRRDDVDLFEINEAFAVVSILAQQELGIPTNRLNVNGGACALGHPIGASGARILVTLISALKRRSLKRGVAAVCIGGGEATAIAVELI